MASRVTAQRRAVRRAGLVCARRADVLGGVGAVRVQGARKLRLRVRGIVQFVRVRGGAAAGGAGAVGGGLGGVRGCAGEVATAGDAAGGVWGLRAVAEVGE